MIFQVQDLNIFKTINLLKLFTDPSLNKSRCDKELRN